MKALAGPTLVLAWALGVVPAPAQTPGSPVEAPSALLSPEKQAVVRDYVKQAKVPLSEFAGTVTVGMTLPKEAELFSLPQDAMTEVPTVTSYRFIISGSGIAVVEPEHRKVVQIIQK